MFVFSIEYTVAVITMYLWLQYRKTKPFPISSITSNIKPLFCLVVFFLEIYSATPFVLRLWKKACSVVQNINTIIKVLVPADLGLGRQLLGPNSDGVTMGISMALWCFNLELKFLAWKVPIFHKWKKIKTAWKRK